MPYRYVNTPFSKPKAKEPTKLSSSATAVCCIYGNAVHRFKVEQKENICGDVDMVLAMINAPNDIRKKVQVLLEQCVTFGPGFKYESSTQLIGDPERVFVSVNNHLNGVDPDNEFTDEDRVGYISLQLHKQRNEVKGAMKRRSA